MGYAMVATASIAAVASVLNTVLSVLLRRFMRPPSGGTLGEVVERTEHVSHVTAAGVKQIAHEMTNGRETVEDTPSDELDSVT